MAGLKELAKAGATRISLGQKLEEKRAIQDIQGRKYFKNPKWVDDVSKHLESVRSRFFMDDTGVKKEEEIVKYIDNKIIAGGGEIVKTRWAKDGRTMIWTIKWTSDSAPEEIRYGVRP